MGRVLALDVSHNGHMLSDGANVSKLALIGCSVCERGWPFALQSGTLSSFGFSEPTVTGSSCQSQGTPVPLSSHTQPTPAKTHTSTTRNARSEHDSMLSGA